MPLTTNANTNNGTGNTAQPPTVQPPTTPLLATQVNTAHVTVQRDEDDYDIRIGEGYCGLIARPQTLKIGWGILVVPFTLYVGYLIAKYYTSGPA